MEDDIDAGLDRIADLIKNWQVDKEKVEEKVDRRKMQTMRGVELLNALNQAEKGLKDQLIEAREWIQKRVLGLK